MASEINDKPLMEPGIERRRIHAAWLEAMRVAVYAVTAGARQIRSLTLGLTQNRGGVPYLDIAAISVSGLV